MLRLKSQAEPTASRGIAINLASISAIAPAATSADVTWATKSTSSSPRNCTATEVSLVRRETMSCVGCRATKESGTSCRWEKTASRHLRPAVSAPLAHRACARGSKAAVTAISAPYQRTLSSSICLSLATAELTMAPSSNASASCTPASETMLRSPPVAKLNQSPRIYVSAPEASRLTFMLSPPSRYSRSEHSFAQEDVHSALVARGAPHAYLLLPLGPHARQRCGQPCGEGASDE
ncbi:MAG: hypothetical protein DDT39_01669 [Firmicutes bacterium]|nr:hypothetical protein [candidate division NPL-UPA2 bacterium]